MKSLSKSQDAQNIGEGGGAILKPIKEPPKASKGKSGKEELGSCLGGYLCNQRFLEPSHLAPRSSCLVVSACLCNFILLGCKKSLEPKLVTFF